MVRRLPIYCLTLLLIFGIYSEGSAGVFPSEYEVVSPVDQSEGLQVKVYPNPFADKVVISSNSTIDSYRIYNILGAQVREGSSQLNQLELDTSDLSSGIYMLEVQSGNRRMTVKIVRR